MDVIPQVIIPEKYQAKDGKIFLSEEECKNYEVELNKLGRKQWATTFIFRRFLRKEYEDTKEKCPNCGGFGQTGGGFGSMEDAETCWQCGGSKTIMVRRPDIVHPPDIPPGLSEAMNAAWEKFWNDYDHKETK